MMDTLLRAIATWRLAHLLMYEDGPGSVILKLRVSTGMSYTESGDPIPHKWNPLWCFWCTSIYTAGVVAALPMSVVRVLAFSGAAVLVETWRPDDG